MAIFTFSLSSGLGVQPVASAYKSPIVLRVSAGLGIQPVATNTIRRNIVVTVSAGLGLSPAVTLTATRHYSVSVSAGLGLSPAASLIANRRYSLSVSAGLGLAPSASLIANRRYSLSVSAGLGLQPTIAGLSHAQTHFLVVSAGLGLSPAAKLTANRTLRVSAGLGLQPSVSTSAIRTFRVSAGLGLKAVPASYRIITVSVSSGIGVAAVPGQQGVLYGFTVSVGLGMRPSVVATLGTLQVAATASFSSLVTCVVTATAGVGIPGVSNVGGPAVPLYSGLSGQYPMTFAETPSGIVLCADGVDPMIRWDALSGTADLAGLLAPTKAPTGSTSGLGTITGVRYLYCRYIDSYGNPSNLSPAGVVSCGFDRSIDDIALSGISGTVTIQSRNHGLATGASILLEGISGLPLNGQWTIAVTDQDHFRLLGVSLTSGVWAGGGAIVLGAASITYSAIPAPTQARVAAIQLLRNLEGAADVLFVDATLLMSPTVTNATTVTSVASDEQLAQGQAVVLRTEDGMPMALRYSPPPSNRPLIVSYMGRIFAAGDVAIALGNVQVTAGSNLVKGWGTQWVASMAGRSVYVKGASQSYGIMSVNTSTQTLSISGTYSGSTSLFATYSVRSSPSDRKLIQWSEPDNPEAWPPWNALAIPEDNDEIVGLFVRGTYLYIAEKRHLWRFQFAGDPGRDGHVFLQGMRGAINHRVIANVDDAAYILDESGVYAFDGTGTESIAQDIQAIWWSDGLAPTYQIDWSQDQTLWHASVDPVRTTIRWFVHVRGVEGLTTALSYNYRDKRWWWEQYPVAVTASCTGTLEESSNVGIPSGFRRALAGSECRVVLVLGQDSLDLVAAGGTLRGPVSSATATTLTDQSAAFASYLGGAPVTIVRGTGAGQLAIISSATSQTLTIVEAWTTIPDATSVYQIGGISWRWQSGWLDIEDEEGDTTRDLVVSFQALASPVAMSMKLAFDHSLQPMDWGFVQSQDGVTVAPGEPDIWFDLTSDDVLPGYRVFRMARHSERYAYSDRFVQMDLSGVSNDQTVRVYQVSLRGVDQEGV